jgi:hypothetical protein
MQNSQPSKKSSSRSEAPPQLDLLLEQTTPVDLHQEWQRRQQETERQKIERNFAKLRREQSGRGSLLNFRSLFLAHPRTAEPRSDRGWPLEAICVHLEAITLPGGCPWSIRPTE